MERVLKSTQCKIIVCILNLWIASVSEELSHDLGYNFIFLLSSLITGDESYEKFYPMKIAHNGQHN